jgi:predicted metal-dependent phosphotriesterase family hydrolase
MKNGITRRSFIKSLAAGVASTGLLMGIDNSFLASAKGQAMQDDDLYFIQTVRGRIKPSQLGLTLIHEHLLVDFVGADKVNKNRYNPDEVFDVMLPYLKEIKDIGVTGFAECTPMFLARDAALMKRFADATDMHILTNTGMYREPWLPQYAFEKTADELALMWISEIENGIEDTQIKAGFIKIAVNPGNLLPIQQKIVHAAAKTSKATGATIACHTGHGVAVTETMDILKEEGLPLEKFIFVHAGSESDVKYHLSVAEQGAWVEYDSINEGEANRYIQLIKTMLDKGYEDHLLLSQDRGWYNVGEPKGGKINGFAYLINGFVPLMEQSGIDKKTIDKFLITNPAKALRIPTNSGAESVNPEGKLKSTFGELKSLPDH